MKSTKPSLIILHGALGASSQFEPLANVLSDTFTIHTLTFSGHGHEKFKSDFSIQQFAFELETYIKENNLSKVNIFGYSMGGYVALHLAKNKSQAIGQIFTLGTKFHWTPESAAREVKHLDPDKIKAKVPAFAKTLAERHVDWEELLSKTKAMMLELGEKPALSEDDFTQIKQRVVIGIGSDDNMVSLEESQRVADLLPHGSLQVFEGFKHPIERVDIEILRNKIQGLK